jgi:VWFA-related protein
MKTCRVGKSAGQLLRILFCTSCFLAALTSALIGQTNPAASQSDNPANTKQKQEFTLRVSVEEVRLDAVVVDKNGHQITNLAAGDFEIYQDGKPQKTIASTYVLDSQAKPGITTVEPDASKPALSSTSRAMLPKDQIRRTIVFAIDDLSMTFDQLYYARMSLHKFLDTQMQRGDLISIVRTSGGIGAQQLFSSDKRLLNAAAGNLHWGSSQAITSCGSGG